MTVAVKSAVPLTCTVPAVGETEIVIAGTLINMGVDFVLSAAEVAVRVTLKSVAGGFGAV